MNEIEMIRVPLFIGMTFGALIGRFVSISDELAPQVVMVSLWAIAGIFCRSFDFSYWREETATGRFWQVKGNARGICRQIYRRNADKFAFVYGTGISCRQRTTGNHA